MQRIFDCFAFFNELDLLEIRLHELDPVVDRFVLVESTRTFQKKPKPLYFAENKARYASFLPKIEHVVVDHFPTFFYKFRIPRAWEYDDYQKNQVAGALKKLMAQPEDIVIYSDLDEIPSADQITAHINYPGYIVFEQRHFYYYLNCMEVKGNQPEVFEPWYGSVMCHYKDFKGVDKLRLQRDRKLFPENKVIEDGGWHFAYLGGVEKIIQKIESYAHTEHNNATFKDYDRIKEKIQKGEGLYDHAIKTQFLEIDHHFPRYLRENMARYSQHIVPVTSKL